MSNEETASNRAWNELIDKYDILNKIEIEGKFIIKADQIKEFREPRLMAKWDSSESLPKVFIDNNINILPISRSSYILGNFNLYHPLANIMEQSKKILYFNLPDYYETINEENITSETMAINAMKISGILEDFLNINKEDPLTMTFNGRRVTGKFNFRIDGFNGKIHYLSVNNAQYEIDGGFENRNFIVILEAKNTINKDFNVRQLYYPYRSWIERIKKPIRLVFSVYSNSIYRLFEYKFKNKDNYSSIILLNQKNYSLQNTEINVQDIKNIRLNTKVRTDDDQNNTDIPFVQANSMERIISLMENLYDNPMTTQEIAEFMSFEKRQADYYFHAGRYLGLFQKIKDEDNNTLVILTQLGEKIFRMTYKQRQLTFVKLILEHKIFMEFFDKAFKKGELAQINEIKLRMTELNVCGEGQLHRRAGSVRSWLKWIFDLVNDSNVQ